MKKIKLLIFLLIIFCYSCKQKESFPILYVDPLISANKQNHINYYLRYCEFKDSIVSIDSFKVNTEGLITAKVCIHGYRNENYYQYDSIGRLIDLKHYSDIQTHYRPSYKLDSKNCHVLVGENGRMSRIKYTKDFKKILQEIYIEDRDTILDIQYKYSGDKISAIIKNHPHEKWSTETSFFYDSDGKLSKIINEGETQIISKKTALIQSAFNSSGDKVYYKYFKR